MFFAQPEKFSQTNQQSFLIITVLLSVTQRQLLVTYETVVDQWRFLPAFFKSFWRIGKTLNYKMKAAGFFLQKTGVFKLIYMLVTITLQ